MGAKDYCGDGGGQRALRRFEQFQENVSAELDRLDCALDFLLAVAGLADWPDDADTRVRRCPDTFAGFIDSFDGAICGSLQSSIVKVERVQALLANGLEVPPPALDEPKAKKSTLPGT